MNKGRLRSRIRAALTGVAILLPALAMTATTPLTASASTTRMISAGGTTFFAPTASGPDSGVQTPEVRPSTEASGGPAGPDVVAAGGGAEGSGDEGGGRTVANMSLTFQGLYHRQQRLANGGNQFSVEPPDQGLCEGNGFVLETVNDVMRVFDTAGNPVTGVQDLNSFYHYAPAIVRAHNGIPAVFGPFVTDPSCYFDPATRRWFHVVLTIETNPATGHFPGPNHLDIAVSQTSNPTLGWNIYRVAVQDDGSAGTPDHGCTTGLDKNGNPTGHGPCLGDFPHLGLDANGFFVTTNEYSFFGFDFHGAQVYAFSKRALEAGAPSVAVTQIDTHGMDNGNSGFTLAPSTTQGAEIGTEYFLSSNGADEAHGNGVAVSVRTSNQIITWTLSNTRSLNRSNPELELEHNYQRVDRYSNPPASDQKAGNAPLRNCLNDSACATTFLLGQPDPFAPEPEYALDSSDSRMLQTTLAAGMLWGALDTKLNGKAGIEWFQVRVGDDNPRLARDGFLGLRGQNLTYPAIGLTAGGRGVVAFTVVGPDFFPSAGFATIDRHGTGRVQIAKLGLGPADGFSGYRGEANPPDFTARPRWGDYGAAATVGNTIWIASEMINQTCTDAQYRAAPFGSCQEPGNPAFTTPDAGSRTTLANWSTEITKIRVSASDEGDESN